MSYRASVTLGVLALLVSVTGVAQPGRGRAPMAGGYGRAPVVRGYSPGRFAYRGYYGGYRGAPAGAYWGGGRGYGGWWPRAYYGPGLPWFAPVAVGYSPYWYAGAPYYYANPGYYAWNPGYPGYPSYLVTPPPPAPAPAPPLATVPPPAPAPPAPRQELVLKGVDFETASAELRPESTAILDGVADTVKRCNCSGVEIRGYTDSVGDRDYNQRLSEQRANTVKDYLESHGVAPGVLTAHGFGEDNPIASNTSAEGRAENRRVTVQFSAPAGTQRQN
jgi:outer membrane protein OmpA-like peptidoglycan-associated protein